MASYTSTPTSSTSSSPNTSASPTSIFSTSPPGSRKSSSRTFARSSSFEGLESASKLEDISGDFASERGRSGPIGGGGGVDFRKHSGSSGIVEGRPPSETQVGEWGNLDFPLPKGVAGLRRGRASTVGVAGDAPPAARGKSSSADGVAGGSGGAGSGDGTSPSMSPAGSPTVGSSAHDAQSKVCTAAEEVAVVYPAVETRSSSSR